jgi:4-aminobutyrate aminotransferase-like enzyme
MSAPLKCSRNGLIRFGGFNLRLPVTQAQGVRLRLENGKRILDFTSGHFSSVLGHGHPEIAKTLSNHAAQLDHLLNGMVSPPAVGLVEKLRSLLGKYGLTEALFLNSGTEANEAAIKLAKTYTGKFEMVALADSWHGMTGAALANTYAAGRQSHGPLVSVILSSFNTGSSLRRSVNMT